MWKTCGSRKSALADKPASRTAQRWITLRKWSQGLFLLIFLILFIGSGSPLWSGSLVNLPFRLDPLLMIFQSIAARTLLAGSWLAVFTLILTLIFGRAWCGWICPIGTLLDIFSFKGKKTKIIVPENWRKVKYILLIVILAAAILGNLTLLVLDPITIWMRTMTGSIWQGFHTIINAVISITAGVPFLADPVHQLDQALRTTIFPGDVPGVRYPWLPGLIFLGIIFLNLVAERFWCRYICPLGGFLGVISKFALFKRTVSDSCKGCGLCEQDCPTGTIDPRRGYRSDPAECTMCMNCLASCPRSDISIKKGSIKPEWNNYDPSRRTVLKGSLAAVAGTAILQVEGKQAHTHPFLLRPPGVWDEQDFLSRCLRCGECIRACPTGALQSSILEAGMTGLFTPILVSRTGYCLYSCNRCGETCPVEAIPPLSLPEKQSFVIGWAYIDENRCIPWADSTDCIVCEEMCPLPDKAIVLREEVRERPDGTLETVKLPHVLREKCIGCGICEFKCPRAGESAIRVYRADYY